MILIGVGVYVLLQLALSVWAARKTQSETDYLLAGRTLGIGRRVSVDTCAGRRAHALGRAMGGASGNAGRLCATPLAGVGAGRFRCLRLHDRWRAAHLHSGRTVAILCS